MVTKGIVTEFTTVTCALLINGRERSSSPFTQAFYRQAGNQLYACKLLYPATVEDHNTYATDMQSHLSENKNFIKISILLRSTEN